MTCDFCKNKELKAVYKVPDSNLGMIINVCQHCGLIQSIQTSQNVSNSRVISLSSGADWGNVRHGKGLRVKTVIPFLSSTIPWNSIDKILDIGANRGDFVFWVHENCPHAEIFAIEPDINLIAPYKDMPYLKLFIERYEKVVLIENNFDFVYCMHTLEHATSASEMLININKHMKKGAYFFLEVPNVELLKTENNVEEFFIDKHKFHFNEQLLVNFLENCGFKIILNKTDIYNITFILQKIEDYSFKPFSSLNKDLVVYNENLITNYADSLIKNRAKLREVVNNIHKFMDRQNVVIWGAGRIFDALVKFGGLRTDKIKCLVDEYLWKIVDNIHGIKIRNPETIKIEQPNAVIVLARSSANEIVSKVRKYGVRNVIKYDDLFLASL